MSSAEITIRSIQHYLYCPHRWGLMEIDRAWAENGFVTKANLLHERVHDPKAGYTSGGKRVFTSVPVYNDQEDDLMQVFAQKICVDSVFGGDCGAAVYYADVKKRVMLPLWDSFDIYDRQLKRLLAEMRNALAEGRIPAIRKGQKCAGCSMKDLCMPSVGKGLLSAGKGGNLQAEIRKLMETDQDVLCEEEV